VLLLRIEALDQATILKCLTPSALLTKKNGGADSKVALPKAAKEEGFRGKISKQS
jgi:hypothetical protein